MRANMATLLQRSIPFLLLPALLSLTTYLATPTQNALAATGTTLHVPGDYATIAQALATAQAGDTVQVAPGTYNEGDLSIPVGVSLQGSGWEETMIDGNGVNVVLNPEPDSTIRDLTIRGSGSGEFSAGIWISNGTVTIANTRITENATGIWSWCFDAESCNIHITLEQNLIDHNADNGVNSNEFVVFTLRNNTIAHNGKAGVILNNAASVAENNLITDNTGDGLANHGAATLRHNNVWGNGQDYVGGSGGEGNNTLATLYRAPAQADYRLYAGSPAVDINTLNGTTVGAFPFTPVGDPPLTVTLAQVDTDTWRVEWSARAAAAGYFVYYGPCTRQTTTVVAVNDALSYQITGLSADDLSYVAVSTYTANGEESTVQRATGVPTPCLTTPMHLQVGAFPAGKIRLQWQDVASNEDGYSVERAVGIRDTTEPGAFEEIITLPADTTVYTDTPPALNETYWYRVRAFNAGGPAPYSNQSYNATFEQVPDHDERYLHVLINEARAAPELYGHPEITPVHPLAYNRLLHYAAHSHSQAISNSNFQIGHCDAIGRCPDERAAAVGYEGGGAENLVQGGTGPASVEGANQAFMTSGGHRDNRLCPCAHEIGLGHTYAADRGGQYTEQFAEQRDLVTPNLPSGIAIPYTGTLETDFTFITNYYHAAGSPPEQALVYIDNQPHAMTLSSGNPANGTYRLTARMAPGEHHYHFGFTFDGGSARLPTVETYLLPVAGPTTFTPGDGNGDGTVDMGDIAACARELFDGDGTDPALAYRGSLAGTAGCDANADAVISAGDLSCVVQLILNGPNSCGETTVAANATDLTATAPTAPAELTIGAAGTSADGTRRVPINLTTNGQAISALSFALYPGPDFDSADNNGDGLPDSVAVEGAAAELLVTMAWRNNRLDVALVDNSAPITALADGTLLTLTLHNVETAAVAFDTTVLPSLGSPTGADVPVKPPTVGNRKVFLPLVVR